MDLMAFGDALDDAQTHVAALTLRVTAGGALDRDDLHAPLTAAATAHDALLDGLMTGTVPPPVLTAALDRVLTELAALAAPLPWLRMLNWYGAGCDHVLGLLLGLGGLAAGVLSPPGAPRAHVPGALRAGALVGTLRAAGAAHLWIPMLEVIRLDAPDLEAQGPVMGTLRAIDRSAADTLWRSHPRFAQGPPRDLNPWVHVMSAHTVDLTRYPVGQRGQRPWIIPLLDLARDRTLTARLGGSA